MTFAENTLHPLEITDARSAAHRASEMQAAVERRLTENTTALAEAERAYRQELATRILTLRADGLPATVCADVARGERKCSDLRYARDVAAGVLDATKQEAFRRGADRKSVEQLLLWSMKVALADGSNGHEPQWSGPVAA
jgi:hypothetical protein